MRTEKAIELLLEGRLKNPQDFLGRDYGSWLFIGEILVDYSQRIFGELS